MKKFIAAILVITALLLLLPLGMGVLAKRNMDNRYAHLNRIMGRSFQLELVDYQRGWFSSTAKLKVHLQSSKVSAVLAKHLLPWLTTEYQMTATEKFPLMLDLSILHGPVIVNTRTPGVPKIQFGLAVVESTLDLPWNTEGQQWIHNIVGQKKLVSSASLITYTGSFSNEIVVPKMHFVDTKNEGQFDWSGVTLSSAISSDVKNIEFKLRITPVLISNLKGESLINATAINVVGDTQQGIQDLWFGNIIFSMDNFVMNENGKPVVGVFGIKAVQQSTAENDKVNSSLNYQVAKVDVHEKSYGPSSFTLKLSGLGAKEFRSITDAINGVDFDALPEEQLAFLSLQLMPDLLHMINGASLDIAFVTKAPEGDISFKLNFVTATQNSGIVDPVLLAKNARGECTFSLPKSLLKKILASEAEIAINAEIANAAKENGQQPDFSQSQQLAEKAADEHLNALQQDGWVSASDGSFVGIYEYKEGKVLSRGKVLVDVLEKIQPHQSMQNIISIH